MASPRTESSDSYPFQVSVDLPHRTLGIAGELDLATAALFLDSIDVIAAVDGDITVDLAGVTFLDSIALGAFVKVAVQQRAHGHELHFANPTARHRRLFLLGGLAQMLHPTPD